MQRWLVGQIVLALAGILVAGGFLGWPGAISYAIGAVAILLATVPAVVGMGVATVAGSSAQVFFARLLLWQAIKAGVVVVVLIAAHRLVGSFSWWVALIGMVLHSRMGWWVGLLPEQSSPVRGV